MRNNNGNILIILLIAIVLLGTLTIVISDDETGSDISKEKISLSINSLQTFSNEVHMAVNKLILSGISEQEIQFSHDKLHSDYGTEGGNDSNTEVFHIDGGQAAYRSPPKNINDGSEWEFMGGTALPELGTEDSSELIAILPNINSSLCDAINSRMGYDISTTNPQDTGQCIYNTIDRFTPANSYKDSGANTIDDSSVIYPFMEGCISCGSNKHYIKVLIIR